MPPQHEPLVFHPANKQKKQPLNKFGVLYILVYIYRDSRFTVEITCSMFEKKKKKKKKNTNCREAPKKNKYFNQKKKNNKKTKDSDGGLAVKKAHSV